MTTSIIIPCVNTHIKFLPTLLTSINEQTLLPDEVIISISSINSNDLDQIGQIENKTYPYHLKILKTNKKKFAGENRNKAIKASKGELIICQDADDIPHPRRIELIVEIYHKAPHFNLLLHSFVKQKPSSQTDLADLINNYNSLDVSFSNIPYFHLTNPNLFKINKKYPLSFPRHILVGNERFSRGATHFGNCAFPRKIFKSIQYTNARRGQDLRFCSDVIKKYNSFVVIPLPLVLYVFSRSSYLENPKHFLEKEMLK